MSSHYLSCAGGLTGLRGTVKLIYLALCDDASERTGLAAPGIAKIMEWASCGRSQAAQHTNTLIALGYLERVAKGYSGRRAEFRVFAHIPCCAAHEATSPSRQTPTNPRDFGNPDPFTPVDNSSDASGRAGPNLPERVREASGKGPDCPDPLRAFKPSYLGGELRTQPTTAQPELVPPPGCEGDPELNSSARRSSGDERMVAFPAYCERHRYQAEPPPCVLCGRARLAIQERATVTTRVREQERDKRRARWREWNVHHPRHAALTSCQRCDEYGFEHRGSEACSHGLDLPPISAPPPMSALAHTQSEAPTKITPTRFDQRTHHAE